MSGRGGFRGALCPFAISPGSLSRKEKGRQRSNPVNERLAWCIPSARDGFSGWFITWQLHPTPSYPSGSYLSETKKSHQLVSKVGLTVQVQYCFTSLETIRTIRVGEPRMATSTFTQLLSSVEVHVHWCFTSTETIFLKTVRDGEPQDG